MKKEYIAPLTEKTEVELEQGFMNGSVVDKDANSDNNPVDAGDQEIEGNYDFRNNPWEE